MRYNYTHMTVVIKYEKITILFNQYVIMKCLHRLQLWNNIMLESLCVRNGVALGAMLKRIFFIAGYLVLILVTFFSKIKHDSMVSWRHQMETFTASLALCERNSPGTGGFPSQRPVPRRFDVFFEQTVEQTIDKPVIWDAIALIMMTL